jgi:hypothetical protein
MQHLTGEELARLVEEEPGAGEADHLARCEPCRSELEAMREQTRSLGELGELEPSPFAWRGLLNALEEEGLVRGGRSGRRVALRRIAAGVLLFAGGGVTGALARGRGPGPVVVGAAPPPARTAEEAGTRLRAAEEQYRAALSRYAELAGADATTDPVNRLAALEGIVLTTRAALKESPADPVINGYHLAAMGQRDALLRQISAARSGEAEQPWY